MSNRTAITGRFQHDYCTREPRIVGDLYVETELTDLRISHAMSRSMPAMSGVSSIVVQ